MMWGAMKRNMRANTKESMADVKTGVVDSYKQFKLINYRRWAKHARRFRCLEIRLSFDLTSTRGCSGNARRLRDWLILVPATGTMTPTTGPDLPAFRDSEGMLLAAINMEIDAPPALSLKE